MLSFGGKPACQKIKDRGKLNRKMGAHLHIDDHPLDRQFKCLFDQLFFDAQIEPKGGCETVVNQLNLNSKTKIE